MMLSSNLQFKSSNGGNDLPKILVVDDLKENQRVFSSLLEDTNAQIFTALSGEDALALTMRHHFAVIIMDVMMPGMDGYETANLIRINDETKYTPIIFVTAMEPNEEFENRGYEIGAVDYLFKPIKPKALTGKINVFIELERHRRKIRKTLEDVQRLENRNQLLLKSVGEGILGLDETGRVTFSNPAAQKLLGYKESELDRKNIMDIMCVSNTVEYAPAWKESEVYTRCVKGLGHHEIIGVFWNSKGELFPVEYLATPIRNFGNDVFVGIVMAFQDITERKKTEDKLARLAQIDTLTGLYNRYAFSKQLVQSLARSIRQKQHLALLFIDLDKFKQVNDSLGHEAGDKLLKQCADRLLHCIRDGDVVSRIGGDEFTAILESIGSGRDAAVVSKKIIAELSKPFQLNNHEIFISVSIGIATYPESANNADSLLRCADIAMYKAKKSERNCFQFFTEDMQSDVSNELKMENDLRKAVENNELKVHYQPKINAESGEVVGAEALIRWPHNETGYISPEVFIGKAEEMGLINHIGEFVLESACNQMRLWKENSEISDDATIAVNLSMRQLFSQHFPDVISKTLQKCELEPRFLELEITESMMMQDPTSTINQLNAIHKLGVKISIDDFGTGYSSLSHLRLLPIDCLKIDQSFVQSIGDSNNNAIVKAIIMLGKNLDLKTIAEGVETDEQVQFLKKYGVDIFQGFYFSKPLDVEGFTSFLKS